MLRTFSLTLMLVMVSSMIAACGRTPAAPPTAAPKPTEAATVPAATVPAATAAATAPAATAAATAAATEVPTAEPTVAVAPSGPLDATKLAGISKELDDALAGKLKGTTVTMSGPFTAADAVKFNASVKSFEDLTGIDIQYAGTKEFETSIKITVDGGNPPDIADFPQPGLLSTFVKAGKIVDASQFISAAWLKKNYNQSWLDMATITGPKGPITAGVWQRVNAKSLIWYPKKAFDAAGYKIPTTWDELLKLSDQIVADGDSPWCVGLESGTATGWVATDWMEEIMLRTTTLENYDKWVKGELKFSSPEVTNAAKVMSDLWFKDNYVLGGRASIVTTSFGDAPKPMFTNPPKCWLHHQGNFITSFFPPTVKAGVDYDFFYMPPIDAKYGKPVLVAGDLMAAFNDRPEVRAVLSYFSSGLSVETWIKSNGAISPQADSSIDWYANDVDRGVAKIIRDASSVRFDASDLMPGQVGAGSFWTGMTSYVAGTVTLDQALKEIDAAWPK